MKKAYAIAEQCLVNGLEDTSDSTEAEPVIIRGFGIYMNKAKAIKTLNYINKNYSGALGKYVTHYHLETIDIRG